MHLTRLRPQHPVAQRIVPRLDRPSGNITGLANYEASLGGWLELLSEIAPGLKRAAIMFSPDNASASSFMPSLETAARALKGVLYETATNTGRPQPGFFRMHRPGHFSLVIFPFSIPTQGYKRDAVFS